MSMGDSTPRTEGDAPAKSAERKSDQRTDPLVLDRIYSDPLSAFLHQPLSLTEIKDDCLIFLDTNVLLLPYGTSKESLTSIRGIYTELVAQGRLCLTDRVMQEFEKNVPEQLKTIYKNVSTGKDRTTPTIDIPLIQELPEYKDLKKKELELQVKFDEYKKAAQATLSAISKWNHSDPVRSMYRTVFKNVKNAKILNPKSEDLLKDWKYRKENAIPPGYKDGGKEDTGIGDFLMWRALLDTCGAEKRHAILVSGEAKPDWWHRSDQKQLYIRRELIEEFRIATGGKSFSLINAAEFFQLFGASSIAVNEIEQEQSLRELKGQTEFSVTGGAQSTTMTAVIEWIRSAHGDRYDIEKFSDQIRLSIEGTPFARIVVCEMEGEERNAFGAISNALKLLQSYEDHGDFSQKIVIVVFRSENRARRIQMSLPTVFKQNAKKVICGYLRDDESFRALRQLVLQD